jgi:cytochrome c5
MRLFAVLIGAVCGLTPTTVSAGPFYGPPISGPIIQGPIYPSPIISSSYITPVREQVIIKEKEVVAPIAVPVVVPATVFQYMPALNPGAQVNTGVAAGQTMVQSGVSTAVQQTGGQVAAAPATQAVAQTAAPAQPVQQVVQQTIQTTEQVDALVRTRLNAILMEKQFGIAADAPPPLADPDVPITPLPQPAQQPLQQAQQVQQAPQQAQTASLQARAMTIVGQSCVACHNPKSDRGDVMLVNAQNQWAPVKNGAPLSHDEIIRVVSSGRMPKVSPSLRIGPLQPGQKEELVAWLRESLIAQAPRR